jgi:hypothetical protein
VEVKTLVDIGRMIKLNNILNEIEVGIPLSKQEILNWWFSNDIDLLSQLTTNLTLNDFLIDYEVDDIDGFTDYNYNNRNDYTNNVKRYIEAYYNRFKPNEIHVSTFGSNDEIDIKGTPYKNIEIGYMGGGYHYVYCNNY